jgi:hypothetical protein
MADKVIFKKHADGEVFAAFPRICGNASPETMLGYAQMGQHSSYDMGYVAECRPALPSEYAALKLEMERSIGYTLQVVRRMQRGDFLTRERELQAMAG